MKLSVVVPFYNELRTLPAVIERLLAVDFAALGLETELLFVDDGSTDAGRSLLDPLPRDDVRVLVHRRNRGKGIAVRSGLQAATGDILCIQDADLEYDPRDLPALLQPILDGEYQVVYGSRFKGSAAGLYYTHRVANRLLNLMVNVAFNRYLSDVYTGYKVFTREAMQGLRLTARSFTVEMELTSHFLRKGLVIYEVPISYRARTYAQGKKIHFRDGFLAAGAVVRYRLRPAPRPTGPAAHRAPDEPGVTRAIEGGATIHSLGLEDLSAAVRYRRYLHGLLRPWLGEAVLEVGAGLGDFSAQLLDRRRLVVNDNDPICVRALDERFGGRRGVEVVAADVLKLKVEPPVDTVVAVNVLERRDDDVAALRAMARAAVPGGRLLLIVPAYPRLAGAFDEALGHRRRYTPASLRAAVEAAGLVCEVVRPVNLLGGVAWWAAVRVGRQGRPTPALVRLYDRLVVPAEQLLERRLRPAFGQSLLGVARAPAPIRLDGLAAVVFDTDGVLTDTASVHAAAWKRLFDAYLRQRAARRGEPFRPFEQADYLRFVDGRPRFDGVAGFLASRGVTLPWGDPADPPDRETVCGLGNRKNGDFLQALDRDGVHAFPSSVTLVRALRAAGVATAVVSASRNMGAVLDAAGIRGLFDVEVDGAEAARLGLPGKPDPALFLEAAGRLRVAPAAAAVIEDALAGVEAGHRGGFGLVVGVDRAGQAEALREHGADVVVADLGELRVDGAG